MPKDRVIDQTFRSLAVDNTDVKPAQPASQCDGVARFHMPNTQLNARTAGQIEIPGTFFEQLERVHQALDAARTPSELIKAAINLTAADSPALNMAVTHQFQLRCTPLIERQTRMCLDEFTKLEALSCAWDVAPYGRSFYETVQRNLNGATSHDECVLADATILIILKEEFPSLPLMDAVSAFSRS